MFNLNSVLLEGNLTSDAELRETPRGTRLCVFSIASNRTYKKDEKEHKETSFFDVELWGKSVGNIAHFLQKGKGVRVMGRLRQDRWEDAEGKRRSRVKVISDHVEFTGSPRKKQKEEAIAEEARAIVEDAVATAAEAASETQKEALPF